VTTDATTLQFTMYSSTWCNAIPLQVAGNTSLESSNDTIQYTDTVCDQTKSSCPTAEEH